VAKTDASRIPPGLLLVCVVFSVLFAVGCVAYRWRPVPITQLALEKEGLIPRDVVVETDAGPIGLRVQTFEFPYIAGTSRAENGGVAEIDLTRFPKVEAVQLDLANRVVQRVPIADVDQAPQGLIGRNLSVTGAGTVVLRNVTRVEYPWVQGTVVGGRGLIRVDLRQAHSLSVHEVNGPGTVVRVVGFTAATVGAVALLIALTKESCPFVYVDRGAGWELVGEAYAGAAFRSTQRDDLLPIPSVRERESLRIRLRNEARETQYTDLAALILVDHRPEVRALSTFNNVVAFVGPSRAPLVARDRRGPDVTDLVRDNDQALWETDAATIARMTDEQLSEELIAEFDVAGAAQPVLELVAGNTTWLDLVFGRFFAAMGPRLGEYLEQGNDPSAGPRIQRWREREGVDMLVEVRDEGGWRQVAVIPTVGPAALREIAVPLPADAAVNGRLEVRLRGGLGFWRIDKLALSDRSAVGGEVTRVVPRAAMKGAVDDRAAILQLDGRYDDLSEMNESLELDFAIPALGTGLVRTAFLHTNGYYNVHQPLQSQWRPGNLLAIRDEAGALSRFGRDLAFEYAARLAATPEVSLGAGR